VTSLLLRARTQMSSESPDAITTPSWTPTSKLSVAGLLLVAFAVLGPDDGSTAAGALLRRDGAAEDAAHTCVLAGGIVAPPRTTFLPLTCVHDPAPVLEALVGPDFYMKKFGISGTDNALVQSANEALRAGGGCGLVVDGELRPPTSSSSSSSSSCCGSSNSPPRQTRLRPGQCTADDFFEGEDLGWGVANDGRWVRDEEREGEGGHPPLWSPSRCSLPDPAALTPCGGGWEAVLRGERIVFMGDSLLRQAMLRIAALVRGQDSGVDTTDDATTAAKAGPRTTGLFDLYWHAHGRYTLSPGPWGGATSTPASGHDAVFHDRLAAPLPDEAAHTLSAAAAAARKTDVGPFEMLWSYNVFLESAPANTATVEFAPTTIVVGLMLHFLPRKEEQALDWLPAFVQSIPSVRRVIWYLPPCYPSPIDPKRRGSLPDDGMIRDVNARRAVLLQGLPWVHSVLAGRGVRMTVLDPCEWGKGEELGYSRLIDGMHFMCGLAPMMEMGKNGGLPVAPPNGIKTTLDGDCTDAYNLNVARFILGAVWAGRVADGGDDAAGTGHGE
jgi:hypothetical protein